MPERSDELMTVAEVAAILKLNQQTIRLNQQTIRNWIDAGRLPCALARDACVSSGPTSSGC